MSSKWGVLHDEKTLFEFRVAKNFRMNESAYLDLHSRKYFTCSNYQEILDKLKVYSEESFKQGEYFLYIDEGYIWFDSLDVRSFTADNIKRFSLKEEQSEKIVDLLNKGIEATDKPIKLEPVLYLDFYLGEKYTLRIMDEYDHKRYCRLYSGSRLIQDITIDTDVWDEINNII